MSESGRVSVHSCPCDGCTDRVVEPNCHMTCKGYLAWQEELKKCRQYNVKESMRYAITETHKRWANQQMRKKK